MLHALEAIAPTVPDNSYHSVVAHAMYYFEVPRTWDRSLRTFRASACDVEADYGREY